MDLDGTDATTIPGSFKQLHIWKIYRKHSDRKIPRGEGGISCIGRLCKMKVVEASRRKEGVDVDEAVTGMVSRGFVNLLYHFEDQPRCKIQDLARELEKRSGASDPST